MHTGAPLSEKKEDHYHRYMEYAAHILSGYDGKDPFHLYIKKYFTANRKHGSRDRKQITSLCYHYFRLGKGVSPTISTEDKILLAMFLMNSRPSPILEHRRPEWNQRIHEDIAYKLKMTEDIFSHGDLFPFRKKLSDEIDLQTFSLSFLKQPKLFIRIRPGYENIVRDKLQSAHISFETISDACLAFDNTEKISGCLLIDKEAVIQDYNSQRTAELLHLIPGHQQRNIKIWDCCAASGGKSILAYDLLPNIQLTVSDKRKNILENLKARFAKAGIKDYHSFVTDLSSLSSPKEIIEKPDLIIADVPCSGSGTWSRTPEQLHYFSEASIESYSELQKKIISNVVPCLDINGYLLYITCSVFKKENEENVHFIMEKLNLELIESRYLKGYEMQADTMFAALFRKK